MAHQSQNPRPADRVTPPAPRALLSRGGQLSVDDAVSQRLCASMSPRMRAMLLARRRRAGGSAAR